MTHIEPIIIPQTHRFTPGHHYSPPPGGPDYHRGYDDAKSEPCKQCKKLEKELVELRKKLEAIQYEGMLND